MPQRRRAERRWIAGALALALAACSAPAERRSSGAPGGPGVGEPAPIPVANGDRVSLPPGGASEYREPAPATAASRRDPVAASVAAAVVKAWRAAGRAPLPEDARLSLAAADLAATLPQGRVPPDDLVAVAMARRGLVEPPPHLFVALVSPGQGPMAADLLLPELGGAGDAGRWARFGVGSAPRGDQLEVVLALGECGLDLDPVPRHLDAGGTLRVTGAVHVPYQRPEVFVTRPTGPPVRIEAEPTGNRFGAEVQCDAGPGVYQVEVTGEDRTGPVVLANFPVYCGVPEPQAVDVPAYDAGLDGAIDAPGAESLLAQLVADERVQARVPPVPLDRRLSAIARAHSCDMQQHGYVGHLSPTTGSAADRVQAGGLFARRVLENVALAYTVREVARGLYDSPGHRANLLDPALDAMGIGVCLGVERNGHPELYVTELFLGH